MKCWQIFQTLSNREAAAKNVEKQSTPWKKKEYQLSGHSSSGCLCEYKVLAALYNSWGDDADGHTVDGLWKMHQHNSVRRWPTMRLRFIVVDCA